MLPHSARTTKTDSKDFITKDFFFFFFFFFFDVRGNFSFFSKKKKKKKALKIGKTHSHKALNAHEVAAAGYGTKKTRVGSHSVLFVGGCALCLDLPDHSPVCGPCGCVFCRDCLVESMARQREELRGRGREWERARRDREVREEEGRDRDRRHELDRIERMQTGLLPVQQATTNTTTNTATNATTTAADGARGATAAAQTQNAPSDMWLVAPSAGKAELPSEKPSMDTLCPSCSKPLKLKQALGLRYTPRTDAGGDKDGFRYMCPSCERAVTNTTRTTAVTPCGCVLCTHCARKAAGEPCPVCSGKAEGGIDLPCGGSGFAAHDKLEAVKHGNQIG